MYLKNLLTFFDHEEKKKFLNIKNEDDKTLLHMVILNLGQNAEIKKIARFLIKECNIIEVDIKGQTALHMAVETNTEIIKCLIKKNGEIRHIQDNEGNTFFHSYLNLKIQSCKTGKSGKSFIKIAEIFTNIDILIKNKNGETILELLIHCYINDVLNIQLLCPCIITNITESNINNILNFIVKLYDKERKEKSSPNNLCKINVILEKIVKTLTHDYYLENGQTILEYEIDDYYDNSHRSFFDKYNSRDDYNNIANSKFNLINTFIEKDIKRECFGKDLEKQKNKYTNLLNK